jgi:hypothetical protein
MEHSYVDYYNSQDYIRQEIISNTRDGIDKHTEDILLRHSEAIAHGDTRRAEAIWGLLRPLQIASIIGKKILEHNVDNDTLIAIVTKAVRKHADQHWNGEII